MDITLAPQLNQSDPTGDSYLRLQIGDHIQAILSMEHTQEVLVVPIARITPVPNMPACVLGLLNRQNKVLWVIDLAQMLKLPPVDANSQQYHLAIIRVGAVLLGLIVQEIKGVTRFSSSLLQPAVELVNASLISYLDGCIVQQQEIILVLNAAAIVNAPLGKN